MKSTTPARPRSMNGSMRRTNTLSIRSTRFSIVSAMAMSTSGRLFAASPTAIISATSSDNMPLSARGLARVSPARTASAASSIARPRSK